MNLKNYTSSVAVSITVSRIESCLAEAGATGIMKDYEAGHLTSLSFRVKLPNGKPMSIRLPANAKEVHAAMMKQVKRAHKGTSDRLRDQAGRTAWKLMEDWVRVQLSLIQMQQADFVQVFLPYLWDGKQTYYQALKKDNFLALPAAQD